MTPTSMFRMELHLPCDMLFGASPGKEQPITDYMAAFVDCLNDIHHYAHQHLKAHYDCLAKSARFQVAGQV
jgi:hypothetical protein